MNSLILARALIGSEREALGLLESALDQSFSLACEMISAMPGKLVVTGMGKAGLIGQKISATLRSTGQPSVFLDPAQALHGDMGMLGFGDGLLALSNSGETDEVIAVARYALEHRIEVVAITRAKPSPLAELASALIGYPLVPEGCSMGRAPMASTMMMLAIGDAIAAVLMERRGFTEQDFLALHHGGYLGREIARTCNAESN